MADKRRFGVIEVQRVNAETYHLMIDDVMWSEVEWSRSRQCWCVQDAAGQCLSHVESIVGQDRDVQTAIRLAKRMIVSGEMPTPEQARAAHERRRAEEDRQRWDSREEERANRKAKEVPEPIQNAEYLGDPFSMDPEPLGVPTKRR